MARAFCLARSPIAFARTHFGKHLHYHRSYQLLAVVQLSRKNGYATALQLFDLTPQMALREPLWMLEVPDCWAHEHE